MSNQSDSYSISHSTGYILIYKYWDKAFWAAIFILIVISFGSKGIGTKGIESALLATVPTVIMFGIAYMLFKDHAWRIDVDFSRQTINFFMPRSNSIVKSSFGDITSITLNGRWIFEMPNRKILFTYDPQIPGMNESPNKFNRIRKIEWGKLCSINGPKKELRDELDRLWNK